jgi:ubiquinone/menaquinone biosynthesis C-methylase UbiE
LLTFGSESKMRAETIRCAALKPGETVLDVGCGTGTVTLLAKAAVGQHGMVYGIDASPEMIDTARHKALDRNVDVDFQLAVIESLPFPTARLMWF